MTETAYPLPSSSVATSEQWLRLVRGWGVEDGVFSPTYLVTGNDLKVTGSNATNVAVAAGEGTIGGVHYVNSATLNLAVPTNAGGGSSRKDIVVLQLDQGDGSVNLVYRTGSSSAWPTVVQDEDGIWETEIAQVTVPAGSATVPPGNVTPTRRVIAPHPIIGDGNWRPPAKPGQLLVEPSAILLGTTSGAWQQLYPTPAPTWIRPALQSGSYGFPGGVRDWIGGSSYYDVAYAKFGDGVVRLRGAVEVTTAKTAGSKLFTLPAGLRPVSVSVHSIWGNANAADVGRIDIQADGDVVLPVATDPGSVLWLDNVSFYAG
jgi:hypothetical protein